MSLRYFRLRTSFLIPLALLLVIPAVTSAQRAAVSKKSAEKSSVKKPVKKTRSEREREREKAKRSVNIDEASNAAAQKGPTVKPEMTFLGESASLESLAARPRRILKGNDGFFEDETEELFEFDGPKRDPSEVASDPAQTLTGPEFAGVVTASFDFIPSVSGAPPDATLAVSPNYIVVWTNTRYGIFNRAGTPLLVNIAGNTVFVVRAIYARQRIGGDPILQYDRFADRWILSQFAFNLSGNTPTSPYLQCFAVSTTNDPRGTYFRYSVTFSPTSPSGFNDYGKLGVMPDAYYTSYNIFGGAPAGSNTGVALCASDRVKMLAGDASATTLCGPIAFYGGGASFLPADLDGYTLPSTATQGGIFLRQSTSPSLELIKLKPNFVAGTVTLTNGFGGAAGSTVSVPIPASTRACNGSGGTCVAQPGTANLLDTLGSRLMYRAALRNRGGSESLVVAQSIDPDGAGTRSSAARWYEISNPFGATPTLAQVSTFDEGGVNDRWMGSVAMNRDGDMMMGYSIVNSATGLKPSVAMTGRKLLDPANTMQTESIAFTGSGSQTGTLTRWGDYFTIQVDPADDRGFCFVGEYLPSDGTFNWRTRVICAKFPVTNITVSGKVTGPRGRSLVISTVTLTDSMNVVRTTATDSLGNYQFTNVPLGDTYRLTATNRRYAFGVVQVTPTSSLSGVNLVGH